jgi:aminopeptidase YwaD
MSTQQQLPVYKRTWFIMLVALLLIATFFGLQGRDPRIDQGIEIDRILYHIEALSEDIGPRFMGTTEEIRAAQYIADAFEQFGYEVQMMEFMLPEEVISPEVSVTAPAAYKLFPAVMTGSGTTDSDGLTGRLVDWEDASAPPEAVTGGIVLMDSTPEDVTNADYSDYMTAALDRGAMAVIVVMQSDEPTMLEGTVGGPASIPMLMISAEQGEVLRSYLATKVVTIHMVLEGGKTSHNVVASRKPGSVQENDYVLIVGSHYDSVYGSPGANDNAASVATMLELARVASRYPLQVETRFIAFGGEERGFQGSRAYIQSLSAEEIERVVGMINMEMLGSDYEPVDYLFTGSASGHESFMTEAMIDAGERIGTTVQWAGRVGGSDHVPFYEIGIYESVLSRSYPGTIPWDPEERHGIEPQYHSPQDTLEHMDRNRLEEAARVLGGALNDIIREETSFWRRLISRSLDFQEASYAVSFQ